jgi:hypothetical protein
MPGSTSRRSTCAVTADRAVAVATSGRPVPDLLVLSGPALGDGLPRWQHIVAPLIARIWPTLAFENAWGPDVL